MTPESAHNEIPCKKLWSWVEDSAVQALPHVLGTQALKSLSSNEPITYWVWAFNQASITTTGAWLL
jgi:hypothetical protein